MTHQQGMNRRTLIALANEDIASMTVESSIWQEAIYVLYRQPDDNSRL
jgi:hypothetical protein